jgi:hypothetical protein
MAEFILEYVLKQGLTANMNNLVRYIKFNINTPLAENKTKTLAPCIVSALNKHPEKST